ncbi:MAG TPA: hypothetical protein VJ972_05985 [Anaerolineales bacterium]|nr:hypothetical protein [Anaerolineales bacterium]
MMRRVRIILGIVILSASIILLIWAYKPLDHETRTQPIAPSDMQLPTPVSLLTYPELVS